MKTICKQIISKGFLVLALVAMGQGYGAGAGLSEADIHQHVCTYTKKALNALPWHEYLTALDNLRNRSTARDDQIESYTKEMAATMSGKYGFSTKPATKEDVEIYAVLVLKTSAMYGSKETAPLYTLQGKGESHSGAVGHVAVLKEIVKGADDMGHAFAYSAIGTTLMTNKGEAYIPADLFKSFADNVNMKKKIFWAFFSIQRALSNGAGLAMLNYITQDLNPTKKPFDAWFGGLVSKNIPGLNECYILKPMSDNTLNIIKANKDKDENLAALVNQLVADRLLL